MINRMAEAMKYGLMVPYIKVSIKMPKNMAKEYSTSVTIASTKDSLITMIFMVMANMFGQMVGVTKENGRETKYTAKALLTGMMVEFMKESTSMIKNMVSVSSNGLMEGNILDIGKMVSSMVWALTSIMKKKS